MTRRAAVDIEEGRTRAPRPAVITPKRWNGSQRSTYPGGLTVPRTSWVDFVHETHATPPNPNQLQTVWCRPRHRFAARSCDTLGRELRCSPPQPSHGGARPDDRFRTHLVDRDGGVR